MVDLVKVSKAREYLIESEEIKEKVKEILKFCEREETDEIVTVLEECQENLKRYIIEKLNLKEARKSKKFREYYKAIDKYVKSKEI